jgi:hypothetical protein
MVKPRLDELDLGETRELRMREFEQQLDLTLALVYGWAKIGYPRYLANYELCEIETEEKLEFNVNGQALTLLTRADIISRVRSANEMYVIHNLKTVANPDQQWREQWAYDQQTLTERIATEARLGKDVIGVVIEGLAKGRKQPNDWPPGSGFYQHNSPLIYAWADKLDGQTLPGEQRSFYSRYEWTCGEPHVLGNGRKCFGGKNHRLSGAIKERVADAYPGGIFNWIDYLLANDKELVEQQFISVPPIGRSPFEIERWKRGVLPRELNRQMRAVEVNSLFLQDNKGLAYELLDYHFPIKSGHGNCWAYRKQCQFFDICHGSADPFDTEMFGPREPNHPEELAQIAGEE